MQNVQDFVTSFLSEDAGTPQEPAANLSKVDTQEDVQHVAVPQEPTTDSTSVTHEPPAEEQKIDDLEVAVPQEPATSPASATQEPPVDDHDQETHQDVAATDSTGVTQEPPVDKQ